MKVFPLRFTVWRRRSDCVVSGALYWALRASQLLGVAPLQFQRSRNARDKWRIKVSHAQSVFNHIRIVILSLCLAALSINTYKIQEKGSIMRLTNEANKVLTICMIVFGAASRMKKIISVLDQVNEIKAAVTRHLKYSVSSEKPITVVLVAFYVFYCYSVDLLCKIKIYHKVDIYVMFLHIMHYILLLISIMLIVQFFLVTHEVCAAIKLLNNNLLLLTDNNKISSGQKHKSVRDIFTIYRPIPDIIRQLEGAFGMAVLVLTVVCFLSIIYRLAFLVLEDHDNMDYWMWINAQLVLFAFPVVAMEIYHRLKLEMNRTKRLVGHLVSISPDSRTTSELVKFSQCLLLGDWNASTMKLCVLSKNSIAGICGNIATYVLMVFNFNAAYGLASKNRPK